MLKCVAAVLIAQTALIAGGLLVERVRRRRAEAAHRLSYEEIRSLCGRLLIAHDAERAHLARELHDDVIQRMTVLLVDLQTLIDRQTPEAVVENQWVAADAAARATAVVSSLRALAHRLHPAHLRLVGLAGAIASLQREFSNGGVSVTFSEADVPADVSPDATLCLYRVAHEAVGNAITHGRADAISVRLHGSPGHLEMTIADNGVGFDVDRATRGLGLISLRERVQQLGGTIEIRSHAGKGTELRVTLAPRR